MKVSRKKRNRGKKNLGKKITKGNKRRMEGVLLPPSHLFGQSNVLGYLIFVNKILRSTFTCFNFFFEFYSKILI